MASKQSETGLDGKGRKGSGLHGTRKGGRDAIRRDRNRWEGTRLDGQRGIPYGKEANGLGRHTTRFADTELDGM